MKWAFQAKWPVFQASQKHMNKRVQKVAERIVLSLKQLYQLNIRQNLISILVVTRIMYMYGQQKENNTSERLEIWQHEEATPPITSLSINRSTFKRHQKLLVGKQKHAYSWVGIRNTPWT